VYKLFYWNTHWITGSSVCVNAPLDYKDVSCIFSLHYYIGATQPYNDTTSRYSNVHVERDLNFTLQQVVRAQISQNRRNRPSLYNCVDTTPLQQQKVNTTKTNATLCKTMHAHHWRTTTNVRLSVFDIRYLCDDFITMTLTITQSAAVESTTVSLFIIHVYTILSRQKI